MKKHSLRGPAIRRALFTNVLVRGLFVAAFAPLGCSSAGSGELPTEPLSAVQQPLVDSTTPAGTWYLNANGSRIEVSIQAGSGGASGSGGMGNTGGGGAALTGTIKDEGGSATPLSNITWDSTGRWLEFRRTGSGFFQWYRLSLVQGVVVGRFSHGASDSKPLLTSYAFHATGWSPSYLDTATSPRTWRVTLNGRYQACLLYTSDAADE